MTNEVPDEDEYNLALAGLMTLVAAFAFFIMCTVIWVGLS